VAGVPVGGFLDAVVVVPATFDGAGTGPVPAEGVEVLLLGEVGQVGLEMLRGKVGPTARRMTRTVRLNLSRSGSMPALAAAAQIRALIA
jgi:hypothetical protein